MFPAESGFVRRVGLFACGALVPLVRIDGLSEVNRTPVLRP